MRDTHIPDWVNDLDLAARLGTPELARTGGDAKGPHALAISIGFEKLNLSGVLSIDQVPSVAFLELPQADETRVRNVHRALWNQGLVSVLIVCLKQEYRLYSVWESPMPVDGQRDGDRLLIEILRTARDAFRLRTLITEIESGRYFETHRPHFKTAARVDSTLLVNLEESEKLLASESLDQDSARAALLHVIFISYLEDRGILDDQYFADHLPEDGVYCLLDVLRLRSPAVLNKLFASLRRDFKGDVFKGPCSFGTTGGAKLAPQQIEVLSEFREGQIELPAGQRRFWPYDFSFIPVELISSIYDKFLNENDEDRRTYGSYYTPTFLADIVVEQATEVLELHRKQLRPTWVLDPACGSGIFLVRIFQRIVRTWRAQHAGRAPNWRSLTGFLKRIYGIDKQYSAIRIAAFSLYLALLEEVEPPAIRKLLRSGKILPRLVGHTLTCSDFFTAKSSRKFDIILGNPPWVSRREKGTLSASKWAEKHGFPLPQNELAWAFIWKCSRHVKSKGIVALLLPAMGILHNHSQAAKEAREWWLRSVTLYRVVNFSDVCFQLFDGAVRPTALAVFGSASGKNYAFEYWCPKASRVLSNANILLISSMDKVTADRETALSEPFFWKTRLWARGRDLKILEYLLTLPQLGRILTPYAKTKTKPNPSIDRWVVGQGFQELHQDNPRSGIHGVAEVPELLELPFFDSEKFQPWVIPTLSSKAWGHQTVRRAGYVRGFYGPRILIMQGVPRNSGLLQAAYTEQDFSFRHSIQAITVPEEQIALAKLLAAILNSKFAAWFFFLVSANMGTERSKVHIEEILHLPFPQPTELSSGVEISNQIVQVLEVMLQHRNDVLAHDQQRLYEEIDRLVYAYFDLNEDEITVIEDAVEKLIPSMQPRRGINTPLMKEVTDEEQVKYTTTLLTALQRWQLPNVRLDASIFLGATPWRAVKIHLSTGRGHDAVRLVRGSEALFSAIAQFMESLPLGTNHNIYLSPDLKVFEKNSLLIVKPSDARFWLQSTALNDADSLIGELALTPRPIIGAEA